MELFGWNYLELFGNFGITFKIYRLADVLTQGNPRRATIGIPIRHLPPTSRLSHAQFRRPGTVGLALSRVWSLVDIIRNFLAEPLQSGILNRPISNQQSVGEPYGTIALSSLKFEAEPYARLLFNPVLTHASMGSYIIASCVSCKSI